MVLQGVSGTFRVPARSSNDPEQSTEEAAAFLGSISELAATIELVAPSGATATIHLSAQSLAELALLTTRARFALQPDHTEEVEP